MGILQIDVDTGVLEKYSVLKKRGSSVTAGRVFAAGLEGFLDDNNKSIEVAKPVSQSVLDQLNQEIKELKDLNAELKAGSVGEGGSSDALITAENKVAELKTELQKLRTEVGSSGGEDERAILTQLADGTLTLKDFKETFGETYKTAG